MFDVARREAGEVGLAAAVVESKSFERGRGEEEVASIGDFAVRNNIAAGAYATNVGNEVCVRLGGDDVDNMTRGDGGRGGTDGNGVRGSEEMVGEGLRRAEKGHVIDGGNKKGLVDKVRVLRTQGSGEEIEATFAHGGLAEEVAAVDKAYHCLRHGASRLLQEVVPIGSGHFHLLIPTAENAVVEIVVVLQTEGASGAWPVGAKERGTEGGEELIVGGGLGIGGRDDEQGASIGDKLGQGLRQPGGDGVKLVEDDEIALGKVGVVKTAVGLLAVARKGVCGKELADKGVFGLAADHQQGNALSSWMVKEREAVAVLLAGMSTEVTARCWLPT